MSTPNDQTLYPAGSNDRQSLSSSLSDGFRSLGRALSKGKKSTKGAEARSDQLPASNPFADPPPPYAAEPASQDKPKAAGYKAPPRAQSIYNRLRSSLSTGASDAEKFRFLAEFDTVFLIDDSSSMSWNDYGSSKLKPGELSRWEQTRNVVEQIVPICMRYDEDGVDIYFLNDPYHFSFDDTHRGEPSWSLTGDQQRGKASHAYIGVKNANHIRTIFKNRTPMSTTPTGKRLGDILQKYVDYYETQIVQGQMPPRPLNIIVITDGEAGDKDTLRSALISNAERLDKISAPYHQLGVQFIQVGKDEPAAFFLRELDDGLGKYRAGRELRDIVDCVTHDQLSTKEGGSQFTADVILKVVLGAVNKHLDNQLVREGFLVNRS